MTLSKIRKTQRKVLPIGFSSGLFLLLLASCGPSKVAQCNEFVEVVNKEEEIAETFFAAQQELDEGFSNQDEAAISNAAAAIQDYSLEIDAIIDEVASLELEDETVSELQERYVQSQGKLSEGIVEVAQLMEKAGSGEITPDQLQEFEADMTAAQTKIAEAEAEVGSIQVDYAAYCAGG